jgi:hypothetical protein
MPQFLQIFDAERAVDDAMVAAHRDRHAMVDHDLVAIISGICVTSPTARMKNAEAD